MSEIIPLSIFEESLFGDITGTQPESELDLGLFSGAIWTPENNQELSKSFEMAFRDDEDRMIESPDSGIHMQSNFEFDLEGCSALLGANDPILGNGDVVEPASSVISTADLLLPVVSSENFDLATSTPSPMDSEDEERAEEPKNVSINTTKNDTNSIHSYSIMKVKKPKTLKTKKPANFASKQITLTSQGKKFSVSVDRRKKKLYEMGKLQDPVAEKNRLNALNAKKNRDRKKQQLAEAEVEIEKLREENEELRAEMENNREELDEVRHQLDQLRQMFKASHGGSLPPFLGNKVARKVAQ